MIVEKCIYKITNNINKKVYIGQTNNLKKRWNEHKRLGNSNNSSKKSINSKLYSAMKKYGVENFTIEVIEESTENYNEREKY
jgi:group I intron endonuclease